MTEPSQELISSLEARIEHDPQSPLFARLASYYLNAGRANDALRLCDNGLAHYPFYSTAHLVKGQALAELGMLAEAKHEYEVVLELFPTSTTVMRLWSSIDLGTPTGVQQAPDQAEVAEAAPEPESPPAPEPVAVEEEAVVEEPPAPVAEEQAEEPLTVPEVVEPAEEPVQEPVAQEQLPEEQPEASPPMEEAEAPAPAEDAFGQPIEPAVAEEQPIGAAEKLGLEMTEDSLPADAVPGFGTPAAEAPQPAVEDSFGEPSAGQQQAAEEDAFGLAPEIPAAEPAAMEPPPSLPAEEPAAEPASDWSDAFSQLQQPAEQQEETSAEVPAEEENPFAAFGMEQPSATGESESYEDFTARVRMELFGTENSMTLEDYLNQQSSVEGSAEAPDQFDELAEKLKSSPRITPPVINFAEKTPRSADDVDDSADSGFVTPTLAEIYVKQGWYDDAIKAYTNLAAQKPEEKGKFELRIAEIEEMKRSSK